MYQKQLRPCVSTMSITGRCERDFAAVCLPTIVTYAVIAYLLAFQPFLMGFCSQSALILAKSISPNYAQRKVLKCLK